VARIRQQGGDRSSGHSADHLVNALLGGEVALHCFDGCAKRLKVCDRLIQRSVGRDQQVKTFLRGQRRELAAYSARCAGDDCKRLGLRGFLSGHGALHLR
jgi:hypothetical protein